MRIVIDLQGTQNSSRDRGIGRYARSFAHALARIVGEHEVLFLLNGLFPDTIEPAIAHFEGVASRDQFLIFEAVGPVRELETSNHWRMAASEIAYERFVQGLQPDALIIVSLFEGAIDNSVVSIGRLPRSYDIAVVLHDLIPLLDPERFLSYPPSASWYHRHLDMLRRADLMLAVSESARREGLEHLHVPPSRITRIGAAASQEFRSARARAEAAATSGAPPRFGISRPYLMHTSTFEERKNFEGLLRAFAQLPEAVREAHQLVLVCKISDEDRARMEGMAVELGLADGDMILTGHVSDEELIALYSYADLFVFPSFHEGFGLPALEAMSCGTPTIGSNRSSIPEVIGLEEALFDPTDDAAMATLIERALTDQRFRRKLTMQAERQAAYFSWEAAAKAAMAALDSLRQARDEIAPPIAPEPLDRLARRIADLPSVEPVSDTDLAALSAAIVANDARTLSVRGSAAGKPLVWRIEGPFDSSYSLALVNRETARALAALGHKVVLHSTEGPGDIPVDPVFLAANPDLAAMNARAATIPQQAADVTSRNLYPPRVEDFDTPLALMHHYPWEESGFPSKWVDNFNRHLDLLTVASDHVRKLMIDNGVSVPITVTGNGVDHWERIREDAAYRITAKGFRFLHVSSCFPRKGADVMLRAYAQVFTAADDVSLVIKTFDNPHNEVPAVLEQLRRERPDFPDVVLIVEDLSPERLKALYLQCHVLVAPSRAEGYGLPIAEAMLSGLPSITTGWSGQLDFVNESNSWLIDYRFERARSHFGMYTSVWAEPDMDDLANTMRAAFSTPRAKLMAMAEAGRGQLLADHRWSDVAARLVESVQAPREQNPHRRIRLAWLTTWNTRCGIATYSEHLLDNIDADTVVFGNSGVETIRRDGAECERCWQSGKERGGLASIMGRLTKHESEALVIQFNYAFFNHDELAELIDHATAAGVVVIVILHSTVDPVREIPGSELFRIRESLARCDRLLVHGIEDLNRLKAIGLIKNVALFPHGVLRHPSVLPRAKSGTDLPIFATYGFCLPHKGLAEVLKAVALVRDRGAPVRLRMLNAEFPAEVSADLARSLREEISRLALEDLVELDTSFHSDAATLKQLQAADALVFAYQRTGESASGAVRYGLAVERPVLVTPVPIFQDLGDAVVRTSGNSPEEIADGIFQLAAMIRADGAEIAALREAAARWRNEYVYQAVGRRLGGMIRNLARSKQPQALDLAVAGVGFATPQGVVEGRVVRSTGAGGILFEGTAVLPPGRHRIELHGCIELPGGGGRLSAYDDRGALLGQAPLASSGGVLAAFRLDLQRARRVTLRATVAAGAQLAAERISVRPASSLIDAGIHHGAARSLAAAG